MANFSNFVFEKSVLEDVSSPELAFENDEINEHMFDYSNNSALLSESNGTVTVQTTQSEPDQDVMEQLQIMYVRKVTTGIVIPIFYFFLLVFGIVGNGVVIYVSFFLTRKSKNAVDIFVGNLAVADLALITTLPFWAVANLLNGTWIFGDTGCKLMSFLTHVNMFSSVFLITAMAVDRYTVVVKAVKVRAKSLRTVPRILCSCAVIWMFSMVLSLPSAIFRKTVSVRNNTYCSWVYPKETTEIWWALHIVARNIIAFVIPLVIICRCYCVIVSYVKTRSNSCKNRSGTKESNGDDVKEKQSQRVTCLVTAIILAFVVCWLPNQVSNFCHGLIHFKVLPTPATQYGKELVYLTHIFTTILSFCNSVVNPVIYSTSPSHRMHIKMIFFRVFRCFKSRAERKEAYVAYQLAKKTQKSTQVKIPAPSTPQGPTQGDRHNTEVTRLPLMSGQDSPRTSIGRSPYRNYSAIERRGSPSLTNSPTFRLPTGVERAEIPPSTPMIVVNDHAETASPGDNAICTTLLLGGNNDLKMSRDVQERDKIINADANARETLL